MRITNKVMQNNALSNINRNKVLQDDLNNQIATGKKIMKPSDDPVVAIRALRLRSDVSQINQYYEKNVPDAQAWLSLTETSLKTTIDVIKSTVSECEHGATDTLQTSDRNKIIDSLKALRDEIYKTGDADYAGRYIFTGYRTDTPLSFGKETTRQYEITQTFSFDDCEKMTYVDTANLNSITEANFDQPGSYIAEASVDNLSYYRFRLAYDALDGEDGDTIELFKRPTAEDPDAKDPAAGVPSSVTVMTDAAAAYKAVAADGATGLCYLIPSTGELVMSKDVYNAINNLPEDQKNLNVVYHKSNWQSTDLRPEHYFYCRGEIDKDKALATMSPDMVSLIGAMESEDLTKIDELTGSADPEVQSAAANAKALLTTIKAAEPTLPDKRNEVATLTKERDDLQYQVDQLEWFLAQLADAGFSSPEAEAKLVTAKADLASKETELATAQGELATLETTYEPGYTNSKKDYADLLASLKDKSNPMIEYNPDYRFNLAKSPDQRIEYQVGFDQSVQVNSYASDVYQHAIGRDVDEIIKLAEQVTKAEDMVKQFENMSEDGSLSVTQKMLVKTDLDAAKKAETFLKDQLQKTFSKYITKSQSYLDAANEAVTLCGNRDKRVSLAENRLSEQQTTFKTLQSNNEDADATDVAVRLSSAEVSYEAALMATGKMIQTTLLNYL